ncbi:hypothetical protein EVJ58_g382 [Rhodofomes roseus]|uniref:Uncharacterized protein n=1 Tax=Rhodofomes roseus TaxID=34475 RepID=A0A4Y9Z490_9APHY|nr:hypothetical protein EVJ58_g382 [Rhodofomes roseus]
MPGKAARKAVIWELPSPAKVVRKSQAAAGTPDDIIDLAYSSDEGEDSIDQLATALDALTLAPSRLQQFKQLPFLLRNLHNGFRHRCERSGIATAPKSAPTAPVGVVYRYDWEAGTQEASGSESDHIYEEWRGGMDTWSCPLCRLHGQFDTREMLAFHLRQDHNEVKVLWNQSQRREGITWEIVLTIPDIPDDTDNLVDEASSSDSEDDSDVLHDHAQTEIRVSPPLVSISPVVAALSPPPAMEEAQRRSPTPPDIVDEVPGPPQRPLSPILIPKKFREPSPTPSSTAQATTRTRSTTGPPRRQHTLSTRGSLPARYPSPPPPSDLLGPAAQYPYIPDGEYSCRPGGPKVYDLLSSLALEPFGVLSWMIVDREEELFELDDVRDEDKVMMALWNRWIMLHRSEYIFKGYLKGILAFVDEYWRTIHRAAGWGALRACLVMLVANRFLSASEVVKVLKHYESHTGMEYWYQDAPSEEPN